MILQVLEHEVLGVEKKCFIVCKIEKCILIAPEMLLLFVFIVVTKAAGIFLCNI